MWCVCGQLRGVTLKRNTKDFYTERGGKTVVDGVPVQKGRVDGFRG